jgi:hypothetical protein
MIRLDCCHSCPYRALLSPVQATILFSLQMRVSEPHGSKNRFPCMHKCMHCQTSAAFRIHRQLWGYDHAPSQLLLEAYFFHSLHVHPVPAFCAGPCFSARSVPDQMFCVLLVCLPGTKARDSGSAFVSHFSNTVRIQTSARQWWESLRYESFLGESQLAARTPN